MEPQIMEIPKSMDVKVHKKRENICGSWLHMQNSTNQTCCSTTQQILALPEATSKLCQRSLLTSLVLGHPRLHQKYFLNSALCLGNTLLINLGVHQDQQSRSWASVRSRSSQKHPECITEALSKLCQEMLLQYILMVHQRQRR